MHIPDGQKIFTDLIQPTCSRAHIWDGLASKSGVDFFVKNTLTKQQVHFLLQAASEEWHSRLKPQELGAIGTYTGIEYMELIRKFWSLVEKPDSIHWQDIRACRQVLADMPHMDTALAKSRLPCDVEVFRGVSHLTREQAKALVGKTVTDINYGSCRLDEDIAGTFGDVIYRVKIPKGAETPLIGNFAEEELLLPRGHQLDITGYTERTRFIRDWRKNTNQVVLDCTYIPPDPGKVITVEELNELFSGKQFMQSRLYNGTETQLTQLNTRQRDCLTGLVSRLSNANRHLRRIRTFQERLERHVAGFPAERRESARQAYQTGIERQLDDIEQGDRILQTSLYAPCDFEGYLVSPTFKLGSFKEGQILEDPGFSQIGMAGNEQPGRDGSTIFRIDVPQNTPGAFSEVFEGGIPDTFITTKGKKYQICKIEPGDTQYPAPRTITLKFTDE